MSRIQSTFERLRRDRRTALMPYLTMGYPELDSALQLVPALIEGGADLIELGVPFSDPLADGATIQAAGQQALQNGMTLFLCLRQAAQLRERGIACPLVLMSYYNPIMQMGTEAFAREAAEKGIDGVIVPDLPPEESTELQEALRERGLDLIYLLAPNSTVDRVRVVAERASGFLYLVSLVGITGARDRLPSTLEAFIHRVRAQSQLPLAVGFGIASPDQAARVAQAADGAIVGSAFVRAIGDSGAPAQAARELAASLRAGLDRDQP